MRISGYRTRVVTVPVTDVAVQPTMSTYVLLEVRTDEGVVGLGYANRISLAHASAFVHLLEAALEPLVGRDPLCTERIVAPPAGGGGLAATVFRRAGSWPGGQPRAASTIDVALWDIKAKAAGLPVHVLLGGFRDRVPCYASWRIEPGTTEATALGESAKHLVASGFRAMKFHVRHLDQRGLLAHMQELRDAVGPDVDIMVDNYQGWDLKDSLRTVRLLAQLDPYWLEDPMPLDDYEGMRALRAACEVRVCAGEQYRDVASFRRLLEHRSADIAMVDLDLGITGFIKVAHLAEAFGVPVVSHLATEIMAPCVGAVSNGLTVEYVPYAEPFLREPMQLADGQLVLSQRPGVGIEFDEAAVRRLAA
jgi:L-alanine-DL-glutamate epimerase-like enolase superfamily enzyme